MKLQDLVFTDSLALLPLPVGGVLRIKANDDLTHTAAIHHGSIIKTVAYHSSAHELQARLDEIVREPTQSHQTEPKAPEKGLNLSVGQLFRHKANGTLYRIELLTNQNCDKSGFVPTVAYKSTATGKVFSRRQSEFVEKFSFYGEERSESGTKHDTSKADPSLILDAMPRALLAVAEVATFGAKKYARDNWLLVPNALERYTAAKDRHRLGGAISEYDAESGLLHAAHEAWNALAVLELKLRQSEIDAMAFKHTLGGE